MAKVVAMVMIEALECSSLIEGEDIAPNEVHLSATTEPLEEGRGEEEERTNWRFETLLFRPCLFRFNVQ